MRLDSDVLIIGSGIAGLTAAIQLADAGKKVTVLNRAFEFQESNTKYAQGGIIWNSGEESTALATDIGRAGSQVGSKKSMQLLSREGADFVESFLIKRLKIPFDKDNEGHIHQTIEAAHSRSRIIHVKDQTGAAFQAALTREARNNRGIKTLTGHTAVDLISTTHHARKRGSAYEQSRVLGAYALNRKTGRVKTILAPYTLIASGGVGALYEHSTNPEGARGDGIAMAERAGAHVIDMEYVQFHPTAACFQDSTFLVSEAVRGEGGVLLNDEKQRFMKRYNSKLMELAPRDEVARAIYDEMKKQRTQNVWLDCTPIQEKGVDLEKRFPYIFTRCMENGVDIRKDLIPVSPAAHYSCGGIRVDEWGRTNLSSLYAAGEASCTGLHGANRLASTSLLEGLVWGKRAAEHINAGFKKENLNDWIVPDWDESSVAQEKPSINCRKLMSDLQRTMWDCVGIKRSEESLARAWRALSLMKIDVDEEYWKSKVSDDLIGLRNAIDAGLLIITHARRNKQSKGCHYRTDYPPIKPLKYL